MGDQFFGHIRLGKAPGKMSLGLSLLLFPALIYLSFKPYGLLPVSDFMPVYALASGTLPLLILRARVNRWIVFLASIALLKTIVIILSGLINSYDLGAISFREFFWWPSWMLVAIFIYIISSKTANLESRLVKFAKLVTLIQLVIIIIQLFAPSAFDLLWPSIKTRGIEGILRVTGSMYNPNRFAFFMTFLSVLIFARTGPIANWFWVLLIYTMLILSGSRTIMLGFPLLLSVWFLFYSSGHYLRKMVFWGISLLMLLPAMLFIIYLFKDNLRYAAHLFNIIESGSLLSVNSLAKRIEIWDAALHLWTPGSILNFLFGAGARGELGTVDNDFLFVLTRNGLAGFFLHIMMYLSLLWIGLQKRNTYEGRVLFLIVLATMGWGITSETLATMTIGIYVAITVGLALGRGNERMARHSRQDHRVKL